MNENFEIIDLILYSEKSVRVWRLIDFLESWLDLISDYFAQLIYA